MGDTAGVCILTDHHWNHSIDNTRIDCGSRMVVKVDFLGFDRVSLEQSRHVNLLVKKYRGVAPGYIEYRLFKKKEQSIWQPNITNSPIGQRPSTP
jgi:hypothetical protein